MCFLFSSCEVFTDTCVDCASGVLQCDVCHFQDTMPDGSCSACELLVSFGVYDYENICTDACLVDCTDRFEDSCYLVLNNTEQHDNAVNRWHSGENPGPKLFPAFPFTVNVFQLPWGMREQTKSHGEHPLGGRERLCSFPGLLSPYIDYFMERQRYLHLGEPSLG